MVAVLAVSAMAQDAPLKPLPSRQLLPGSKSAAESTAEIAKAISNLGHREFAARERASELLWKAGATAEPSLEKAVAESDDFEVLIRCRTLLNSFHWGIYPDTPPATVLHIQRFRLGDYGTRQRVCQLLSERGDKELLRRLIGLESNPALRSQLTNMYLVPRAVASRRSIAPSMSPSMDAEASKEVQRLLEARAKLAERDFDAAARLLSSSNDAARMRDHAALLHASGKLDASIAKHKESLKASDALGQQRLVWMLRTKGDLTGAVTAAKLTNDKRLLEGLLVESADWPQLAKMVADPDATQPAGRQKGLEELAQLTAYCRLAGDKRGFEKAASACATAAKNNRAATQFMSNALILNERWTECMDGFFSGSAQSVGFDLLVAQNRIEEAFRRAKLPLPLPAKYDWSIWLEVAKGPIAPDRVRFASRVLRDLQELGEDDQANSLIAALTEAATKRQPPEAFPFYLLIEAEASSGRGDIADTLAAKAVVAFPANAAVFFQALYGERGELASLFFKAIHDKFPGDDHPDALRRLRGLLASKPAGDEKIAAVELARIVENLVQSDATDDESSGSATVQRSRRFLALAKLGRQWGDRTMFVRNVLRGGSAEIPAQDIVERGILIEKESPTSALRMFESAWTKDRSCAAALYLLGSLRYKIDRDDGRKRMELALMVPLADSSSRFELIQTFQQRDQKDEVARQQQLLLRTCDMGDRARLQTLIEIADAAMLKADYAVAASAFDQVSVGLLQGNVLLRDPLFYLRLPRLAHTARAMLLLQQGKTADAIEQIHLVEAAMPAYIQTVLDLTPELKKHGADAEAEAMYRRSMETHESLLIKFPRAATLHNDLAWLAANLDRDLDKALEHAKRAVELKPKSAGILDTLAEVHFRRGDKAEALRLEEQCAKMEPDTPSFTKQIERYKGKGK